jgi:LuxR family maltose regulon positive regulatory protein
VGCVSLDERDNQPALFFGYLVAALQTVLPGAGSEALAILKLPGSDLEEVVTLLVNALIVAPNPFFLVLDDLHTISNPALHQALNLFRSDLRTKVGHFLFCQGLALNCANFSLILL